MFVVVCWCLLIVVLAWALFRSTIQPPMTRWQEIDRLSAEKSRPQVRGSQSCSFNCTLRSLDELKEITCLEGEMVVDTKVLKFVPDHRHVQKNDDFFDKRFKEWKDLKRLKDAEGLKRCNMKQMAEARYHNLNHHEFTLNHRLWPINSVGSGWFRMLTGPHPRSGPCQIWLQVVIEDIVFIPEKK